MKESTPWELNDAGNGEIVVRFGKHIDISIAGHLFNSLVAHISENTPKRLTLDFGHVRHLDDFGILCIMEMKETVESRSGELQIIRIKQDIRERLEISIKEIADICTIEPKPTTHNIFVRFGDAAISEAFNVRFMISFLGSVVLSFLHVFLHPKSLRIEETISQMEKSGVDAVPIVGLISFLLGLIMAFMSSIQLRQFGANIYVASLVALAMVSELGPIMTAIVVSGRTGSLFAAEIGTMQVSEEIDALFVMGINPTIFLAVPRILACIIVVPLLTLFSDFFAITGGLVVGVSMLNLTAGSYLAQTMESITLFEVLWGMLKSVIFAALISWAGCLRGFQVRGGADAVGRAATSAVVSSIFLIILFDSMFAVVRSYW